LSAFESAACTEVAKLAMQTKKTALYANRISCPPTVIETTWGGPIGSRLSPRQCLATKAAPAAKQSSGIPHIVQMIAPLARDIEAMRGDGWRDAQGHRWF
jgi:hypothetical protein